MKYEDILIKKINSKLTPKEAYVLNNQVNKILNDKNAPNEIKEKIKTMALLEPLKMLSSCFNN